MFPVSNDVHIKGVNIGIEPNKMNQTDLQAIEVSIPVLMNIDTKGNSLPRGLYHSKHSAAPSTIGTLTSIQYPTRVRSPCPSNRYTHQLSRLEQSRHLVRSQYLALSYLCTNL
jgi:hypothetical protein